MNPTLPNTWPAWRAWALDDRPGDRLQTWLETGALANFPDLGALVGVPQDPHWHPEGDVWIHTRLVCDQAAEVATRDQLSEPARLELLFAALCHDLGKPATTCLRNGHWSAPGHPEAGLEPTERVLNQVGAPANLTPVVRCLVAEHLAHAQTEMSGRAIRRLLKRLRPANLDQLIRLIEADLSGRPPLPRGLSPAVQIWAERARAELAQGLPEDRPEVPAAIIQGRHLVSLGQAPGPWFRVVLDACHAAQLAGEFGDEAGGRRYLEAWLTQHREKGSPPVKQDSPQTPDS
ncbi:MAG: HD domain-containing protein [Planctomycetaceae bacterium]